MKRKEPPYKIKFCSEDEEPPQYVSGILKNEIILGGSRKEISALGFRDKIKFQGSERLEENSKFISIMLDLNSKGVVFSYDPKVGISPSAVMLEFQDRDILNEEFKEISWRGPNEWLLTTYELQ